MDMEGFDSNSTHNIAKGKRTKRMRLLSGVAATTTTVATTMTMTSSCSSANSTTTYESEEEDMANCLILLAQGGESHPHHHNHHHNHHHHHHHHHHDKQQHVEDHDLDKVNNNNLIMTSAVATTTTANTKVGFYVYECKTCNRTFPSFQALGGHRASHKKPKVVGEEKKAAASELAHMNVVSNCDRFEEANNVKSGPEISLQLGHGNNKGKIHECSICGSEFTSGQALGGHMRRHRASTNTNNGVVVDTTSCNNTAPTRNVLQLDLNLPAPEDDLREPKFQFPATQVALVDCHY
ncbi:zinc finger protein ZAT5 [Cajanus cajan]|uniref:zinc finger protein ZAT5 n=1 Tax=Cajanus cajan TaxID=3821 RepID=UPI00098D9410|nr:zinc finger protein ZAT5 [Cajanus cajan]